MDKIMIAAGSQAASTEPDCNCPEVCMHDHENE
jgi:hypothetical protein